MDDLLALIIGAPEMGGPCEHGKMEGTPADQALRDIKAIIDRYFENEKTDEDQGDTSPGPEPDIKETEN